MQHDLYPSELIEIKARLNTPSKYGYYKDSVIVSWRFENSSSRIDEERRLIYEIARDGFEEVDLMEYELYTGIFTSYRGYKNGETVYFYEQEGYMDTVEPNLVRGMINSRGKNSFGAFTALRARGILDDGEKLEESIDYDGPLSDDITDEDAKGGPSEPGIPGPPEPGIPEPGVLDLNYCVRVRYIDNYIQPPVDTTGMKWWRPYGYDGETEKKTNAIGLIVQLWDRDETSADDYIGTWGLYYSADGNYCCLDFQWDQAAENEWYPDPYIKTSYRVMDTEFADSTKYKGHFCTDDCDCNSRPTATWRGSYYSDLGKDETTTLASLRYGSRTSDLNRKGMLAASFQKYFRTWRSYGATNDIYATIVFIGGSYSSNDKCVQLAEFANDSLTYEMYRRWDMPVHEAGHSGHVQLLGQSLIATCPSPHYGYCGYNDHCATYEGWTEFVTMRAWYPNSKLTSKPTYYTYVNEYPIEPGGIQFLNDKDPWHSNCNNACDEGLADARCYSRSEIMVARTYWDIWDNQVDGDHDTSDVEVSWKKMARTWINFPDGTGNSESAESSPYFNMRDYCINSASISYDTYADVWDAMKNNYTDNQFYL